MTPAVYIREHVFGFRTQEEFAAALNYEQPQISRWENGAPFSSKAQERIQALARERGIAWDNNWFFEVSQKPTVPASESAAEPRAIPPRRPRPAPVRVGG